MDKRGQIFSIDLLFAIVVFIAVLAVILIAAYTLSGTSSPYSIYGSETEETYVANGADAAADVLSQTPGIPANWNTLSCSSIKSLGLLNASSMASMQKLYNLTTLPIGCLSELIRGGNGFNITAYYLNATVVNVNGRAISAGFPPPSNAIVASASRFLVGPQGEIVELTVKEWV